MDLTEYKTLAERTLVDKGTVANLLHAYFGITTEMGELLDIYKRHLFYGTEIDPVHVKEELGDVCWYLSIILRTYNMQFTSFNKPDDFEHTITFLNKFGFVLSLNQLTSYMCEHIYVIAELLNGVDFDAVSLRVVSEQEVFKSISLFFSNLYFFYSLYGFNISDILDANIQKLQVRYPEKFTSENALNRDLVSERKVLEGNTNG